MNEYIKENHSNQWLESFPFPKGEINKYDRGHVVVSGGGLDCTGAACLAALAALRIGAGLVTVAAPKKALAVYATKLASVMAKPYSDISEYSELLADVRKNVVLLGPGNGVGKPTRKKVLVALEMEKACVVDADAISSFAGRAEELFAAIKTPVVFTPHEGEFARLFASCAGSREARALEAAQQSNSVVVLKGQNTVIASPTGEIVVNKDAPATLATAGTGDVLAGIIAGLVAQGMEVFAASCAAVWVHSKAAEIAGLGMISEDLPNVLPMVLEKLVEL